MKNLIFINGTMGVGKTAAGKALLRLLPNCVLLDGDWCWYADPFTVNDETKGMAVGNIGFLLNSFLACSAYNNIIFCWVMHEEGIIDLVLSRLENKEYNLYKFSLVCSEEALAARIEKDVARGERDAGTLDRALARQKNYLQMDTIKIDVGNITAEKAAEEMANIIYPV